MPRRNGPDGWSLPAVVHPPKTRCFVVQVPDDREYIAAFRGAMMELASGYNWQNDPDHTAREVALVWRDVIENISQCLPESVPAGGTWEDFEMPIRVDCDCRVWVTCCDGTEVQLATVGMIDQPGQPGGGGTPPGSGECTVYKATFSANSQWLLPALVNSGDELTFSNAKGAGSDGAALWRCPNGQTFFAGQCVGAAGTSGGDPASSQNHMQLVINIDGTWYPANDGTITVPGGVTDAQAYIQVNDASLGGNSGSYTLDVQFCNNAVPSSDWVSTLDFKISPYDSFVADPFVTWGAGTGFAGGVNGSVPNWAQIDMTLTTFELDGIDLIYDVASLGGGSQGVFLQVNGSGYGTPAVPTVGSPETYTNNAPVSAVTGIVAVVSSGTAGGVDHIQKMVIRGHGPKPPELP